MPASHADGGAEDGTMYSQAACAHLRVNYVTLTTTGGQTTGWWQCSECATRFAPDPTTRREAEEVLALIAKANEVIGDLCKGTRTWTLGIPVRSDDPDIVIGNALHAAKGFIAALSPATADAPSGEELRESFEDACDATYRVRQYLEERLPLPQVQPAMELVYRVGRTTHRHEAALASRPGVGVDEDAVPPGLIERAERRRQEVVAEMRAASPSPAAGEAEAVRREVSAAAVAIVDKAFEQSWVVEDTLDALRALAGTPSPRGTVPASAIVPHFNQLAARVGDEANSECWQRAARAVEDFLAPPSVARAATPEGR